MRVWQIDPAQITPFYDFAVCDALAQSGLEITFFTSRFLYDDLHPPVSFKSETIYFQGLEHKLLLKYPKIRQILRGIWYPKGHLEILNQAKREKPDIIHFQWSRVPVFDYWLIQQLKKIGIPLVHTIHDIVPLFHQNKRELKKLQSIYSACDAIMLHAEANKTEFQKLIPQIDEKKVFVIPHVTLHNIFPKPLLDKKILKAQNYISENKTVFLFFGGIRYYKGIDLLLTAFKSVRETHPNAFLLIVGKKDADIDLSLLNDLDSSDYLLHTGYIPTQEAWKYYGMADVAVMPHRHIYQSGALITAMGYELPIIATDVGAFPETIDGNGWLVPTDPDSIKSAMIDAMNNPEKLVLMSNRSRELIETQYSYSSVSNKMRDMYQQLIETHRRR